jgi:hypothetical protein
MLGNERDAYQKDGCEEKGTVELHNVCVHAPLRRASAGLPPLGTPQATAGADLKDASTPVHVHEDA